MYNNHTEKLQLIKDGKLSLKGNVNSFLEKIEQEKELNAFNFIFKESLTHSKLIEEKIKSGKYGRLAGMVIAVKDVLAIKDKPLTCSSNILKNFESVYTASSVQKLIDEDAVIIGKTNCDEFAMGSSNENSAFGPVKNPVDRSRVPGGSSGGSAAAVAAGLCDCAIGTDTGGSIRQPAAFCGLYGLKPTYGRVSRYGLTAYASSFDSVGPISKSIEDIALIMEVISGKDEKDSTSAENEVPPYSQLIGNNKKFRIGIPEEFFGAGLNSEIREAVKEVITRLRNDGHEIEEIRLPLTEYSVAAYYILATAEASSNLARYDGAHYGFRADRIKNLNEMYSASRSDGFGKEVKRRIMLGTYILSAGYYDAYYRKAQKVRRLIQNDFSDAFKNIDIILTPTTTTTAFKLGEILSDPLQMYLTDIYTTSANLAGIPGLNIPIGKDSGGMPIGMQLLADHFNELSLLQLANRIK